MKAFYEVETLSEAMELARQYSNTDPVMLVQNVYKSDYDVNCIVIKYKRA